jgi:hypothetical protein
MGLLCEALAFPYLYSLDVVVITAIDCAHLVFKSRYLTVTTLV